MRSPKEVPTKEIKELLNNSALCANCRKGLEAEMQTRSVLSSETSVEMKNGVAINKEDTVEHPFDDIAEGVEEEIEKGEKEEIEYEEEMKQGADDNEDKDDK